MKLRIQDRLPVRCSCMRAKPEYSASKLALFMVL